MAIKHLRMVTDINDFSMRICIVNQYLLDSISRFAVVFMFSSTYVCTIYRKYMHMYIFVYLVEFLWQRNESALSKVCVTE